MRGGVVSGKLPRLDVFVVVVVVVVVFVVFVGGCIFGITGKEYVREPMTDVAVVVVVVVVVDVFLFVAAVMVSG